MKIPQSKLDEINQKLDILDYISTHVSLSRKGDRFWGCCPFHQEKTPSFSVVPEKGFFYCFSCNRGGNIFKFIMETENVEFVEAVKIAAEKAHVNLEFTKGYTKQDRLKKEALLELYKRVTGSFSWILKNSPEAEIARKYLLTRGIKGDTSDFFQLGYAPSDPRWLYDFLLSKNYTKDFLDNSGLFSKNRIGYPLFRQRLVFPIFDTSGRPVAFSARILRGDGPKYINSPETEIFHKGSLLFGVGKTLPEIKNRKSFILCEGNLDVLALYQSGCKNTVAPLGTAFTKEQLKILQRYSNEGIIVFDNDRAGIAATSKAAMYCLEENVRLKACILPESSDPADIMVNQGEESLKKILNTPINIFDYLLKYTVEKFDCNIPEGKVQVIEELTPYIRAVNSEVERTAYIEKIADILLLDKKTVIFEYHGQKVDNPLRRGRSKTENPEIIQSKGLFLVLLLLFNPELYPIFKRELEFEDLQDVLANQILQRIGSGQTVPEGDQLYYIVDHPGWEFFLRSKETDPLLKMNAEDQIRDLLKELKEKRLRERRDEISLLLKREDTQHNERAVTELVLEKQRIDREIENLKV